MIPIALQEFLLRIRHRRRVREFSWRNDNAPTFTLFAVGRQRRLSARRGNLGTGLEKAGVS
jgi:hypothetical protein